MHSPCCASRFFFTVLSPLKMQLLMRKAFGLRSFFRHHRIIPSEAPFSFSRTVVSFSHRGNISHSDLSLRWWPSDLLQNRCAEDLCSLPSFSHTIQFICLFQFDGKIIALSLLSSQAFSVCMNAHVSCCMHFWIQV